MLSIKEHLTILYVTMADFFDHHPRLAQWRQSNHSQPDFTAAWCRAATRVFSRSWQGLWTTLQLKMLDYSLSHVGIIPA